MARMGKYGIGAVIVVLAALAIGVVQTRADKTPADLAGTWRIDASRSNLPGGLRGTGERRWGGRGGRDGGSGRSGRGEGSLTDRPDQGRGGRRRGQALPPVFHITQKGDIIGFADSTGVLFQEIHVGGAAPKGGDAENEGVRHATGRWSDGTLEVERAGRRGGAMIQKFKVEDDGRTLEVRMERKGGADGDGRPGRGGGFKMVYRRVV